jgi:hypothetical protein
VKEPLTGNSHTNPIVDLTYLPVMYLDTFAIALMATESCYVFMELLDVEDGRSLNFESHDLKRLVMVPEA